MRTIRRLGLLIFLGAAGSRVALASEDQIAPRLVGNTWYNVKANQIEALSDFKGRVTVLHFWTFECINCRHNLPSYAAWAKKYDSKIVQVIGVHTPELKEERSPDGLKKAISRLGIDYPVLVDNDGANWNRYRLEVWPTVFVIDKKGRVRQFWKGELGWNGADGFQELSRTIQALIKEPG